MPVSWIRTTASVPCGSALNRICPRGGVNFTALPSTFAKICTSRAPSPSTQIGVDGMCTSRC